MAPLTSVLPAGTSTESPRLLIPGKHQMVPDGDMCPRQQAEGAVLQDLTGQLPAWTERPGGRFARLEQSLRLNIDIKRPNEVVTVKLDH